MVLACEDDWEGAKSVLKRGFLEGFLGALGRVDLAMSANRAANSADPNIGLDELLDKLPNNVRAPAQLQVQPTEINLGLLDRTTSRSFAIHILNKGMGVLGGSVRCPGTPWLTIGNATRKLFRIRNELVVNVQVVGKAMSAGPQSLKGRIVIESNGGTIEIPVHVQVPLVPFPNGILGGATTPRELAKKAKAAPKEAAALFAGGAVAVWYAANGWIYPVLGSPATGIGAVQQFFEALGLVAPPKVEISATDVKFRGVPGAALEHIIQVQTAEKRPVFAHAVSSVPWLQLGTVLSEGRSARIPVRVASVPAVPGETLHGQVKVTANGNQIFRVEIALAIGGTRTKPSMPIVPVSLAVEKSISPSPATSADLSPIVARERAILPVAGVLVAATDPHPGARPFDFSSSEASGNLVEPPSRRRRIWLPLLPVVFLLLGISISLSHDGILFFRSSEKTEADEIDERAGSSDTLDLQFHDAPTDIVLGSSGFKPADGGDEREVTPAVWESSMRFGLVVHNAEGGKKKRLTMSEQGWTNNTCVHLDGNEWLFGERPYRRSDGLRLKDWPGRWLERDVRLGGRHEGRKSVWIYDKQQVVITQTVEIVEGSQSGQKDTCLVRYRLENRDSEAHRVGIRFLLDTFIGDNDSVPFLIPGARELCTTSHIFAKWEDVPDFIQACEFEDLKNPGTIAHLQLRLGSGLEPPGRVTLGSWPNLQLARLDKRCRQMLTLWEVPVLPIHSMPGGDSAVTMYWEPRILNPNAVREVGFSYGLGGMSRKEGGGKLAVTVGGDFAPRGDFTVTAYVVNPVEGQTVALVLPSEFELLSGGKRQAVPPLPRGSTGTKSPVSWKVRAPTGEGKYTLKVESSNGAVQRQTINIKARGLFGDN